MNLSTQIITERSRQISQSVVQTWAWTREAQTKCGRWSSELIWIHNFHWVQQASQRWWCIMPFVCTYFQGRIMLRSSKFAQPWMLKLCSLAKCNRHMKHRWGEMSLIVAAALQPLGKLDKRPLKDTVFSWSFSQTKQNF